MKTNETIFQEIKAQGFITKQQLQLLKNRSNKEQKNLMDYLRAARLMSFLPEEIRRTKPGSFKAATQLKG